MCYKILALKKDFQNKKFFKKNKKYATTIVSAASQKI